MFDFKRGEILDLKGDRYVVIQRDPDLMVLVLMNAKKVEEYEPFQKIPPRPVPFKKDD